MKIKPFQIKALTYTTAEFLLKRCGVEIKEVTDLFESKERAFDCADLLANKLVDELMEKNSNPLISFNISRDEQYEKGSSVLVQMYELDDDSDTTGQTYSVAKYQIIELDYTA